MGTALTTRYYLIPAMKPDSIIACLVPSPRCSRLATKPAGSARLMLFYRRARFGNSTATAKLRNLQPGFAGIMRSAADLEGICLRPPEASKALLTGLCLRIGIKSHDDGTQTYNRC